MALVPEDGTGISNADSYISVADADTRHTNLGNAAWTGVSVTTAQKEAALRKATNYMEQAYRQQWQGLPRYPRSPVTPGEHIQALSWPRYGVFIDYYPVAPDAVPAEVANACADLALRALSADLNADLTTRVTAETVGPITTEYDHFSPESVRYPAIDMMLAPFLASGGANSRLVRA